MEGEVITSDGIQIVRAFDIPCAAFCNRPAPRRARRDARFMLAIATQAQVVLSPQARARWHTPHELIVLDTAEPWEVRVSKTKMSTVMTVADDLLHQVVSRDELRRLAARTDRAHPSSLMSAVMDSAWTLAKQGRLPDAAPRLLRSIADLLWLTAAHTDDDNERAGSALGLHVRREQFKAYVRQHYADSGLSMADVARHLRVSARHLRRAFAAVDATPARYLHDYRLDASAERLKDPALYGRSITDIAMECGFGNAAHFATTFRARFAQSPREFRLAHAALRADARTAAQ